MRLDDLKIPERGFDPRVKRMMINFETEGQKEPILVRDGMVIDGIVRCLAAQKLGWEEIHAVIVPREKF